MTELIFKEEVYEIYGAAIEVHRELGHGFLEPVYQEALEIELARRRVIFESQKKLSIFYKSTMLTKAYIPDFVCFDKIVVEIKALDRLTNIETAQIINYLKATNSKIGLLLNFGSVGKLERKRFVL